MKLRAPDAMAGPGVSAPALLSLASDCRDTSRGLADEAGFGAGRGAGPPPGDLQWQGSAADGHRQWHERFEAAAADIVVAIDAVGTALDELAWTTARSTSAVAELRAQLAALDPAGSVVGVQLFAVWRRYDQVMAAQDDAESAAVLAVAGATEVLRRVRFTLPRILGLTRQQWRDVGRGVGDVAWDAGPGTVTWAQRWLTVPGLLGAFDPVDEAENDARAWLDDAGGGSDDTATYRWVYGGATAATVALPVPSGKAAAAARVGRAVRGADDAVRGADDAVRSADDMPGGADEAAAALRPVGPGIAAAGPPLPPQARVALRDYTADGFWDMNLALRSGRVVPGTDMARRVEALSAALSQLPAYRGMVYRGTDLTPRQLERYAPGQVVEELSFTSAARIEGGAFPGNVRFEIDSVSGKDVSEYAIIKEEVEVLFDHHSAFRVVGRYQEPDDTVVIVMRELSR